MGKDSSQVESLTSVTRVFEILFYGDSSHVESLASGNSSRVESHEFETQVGLESLKS